MFWRKMMTLLMRHFLRSCLREDRRLRCCSFRNTISGRFRAQVAARRGPTWKQLHWKEADNVITDNVISCFLRLNLQCSRKSTFIEKEICLFLSFGWMWSVYLCPKMITLIDLLCMWFCSTFIFIDTKNIAPFFEFLTQMTNCENNDLFFYIFFCNNAENNHFISR